MFCDAEDLNDFLRSRLIEYEESRDLQTIGREVELRAVRGIVEYLMAAIVTEVYNQNEAKHSEPSHECSTGGCSCSTDA